MQHHRLITRAVLAVLTCLVFACSSKKSEAPDTEEIQYSNEIVAIISHITSGTITPADRIEVQFLESVVSEEELNLPVDNPFSFSPSISGEASWVRTDLLVFIPSKPLGSRVNYSGTLNLSTLGADFDVKEVEIKFYVLGQEITSFEGELEVQNPSNPKELVYRGKISFSQSTTLENVTKAASLTGSTLNWNQENDRSFSFSSGTLTRQAEIKNYRFVVDHKELNLSESMEQNIEVVPLQKLILSEIVKDEEGRSPKMMLKFSDQLDAKQNLEGFVSVTPEVQVKQQQMGKYILLDGDFKFGTEYTVNVKAGVKSKWGTATEQTISKVVKFADIQPQVEFASDGIFLPTSNNKRLQFLTTNLKRVHVEVKKVFDGNIENFFQNESLKSSKDRNTEFGQSYVSTVGAIVYNQTFEIGDQKNEWLIHNLALDNVLAEFSNGLYLIRINFNPHDILVPIGEDELSYIQQSGQIYKPVTISDLGVLAKQHGDERMDVYVTDLKTGQPMPGAKVTVSRYDRDSQGTTNDQGQVSLKGYRNSLVKAEKNGQISIIQPYEMRWNQSGFDIGGVSSYDLQTRGFIYTERGVYRPGDSVNLSCIVRYANASANNAPATFKLFNPEGTLVVEQTQTSARDGFYNFNFGTDQNDPTGNWNAQVMVGNKRFYHTLKVETVVANRLKVKVTPALKTLLPENKILNFDVESKYLFGASASGLSYETEVEIFDQPRAFPKYKDYNFFNQYVEFHDIKTKIKTGRLNEDGTAAVVWNVPNLKQAPSPLKVKINATVQEEGGRPNDAWAFLDLHPFTHYVGIKDDQRYVKLNSKTDVPVILVDHEGNAVSGKELTYRIYRNDSYWWYQYNSFQNFKLRFKTDQHSYLVEEGTVISGKPFTTVPFRPSQKGQYLIEVQDAMSQGHTSSIFVSAYPYGGIPNGDQNAGTLSLRSEKDSYEVGDDAMITFPSPKQGNVLLTVERGDEIILSKWVKPAEDQEDMQVKLKISKSMVPNVYVTVTTLQSHAQTVNDRPIRMFGILPITVVNPSSKRELVIKMADELKPKEKFDIEISTLDGKPTQFTVAVVDEGLLDLTNFQTPNPWKEFYKKVRLEVETYDMFGHVIGANESDVFKTFSIGGDMDYRESQIDPFKKKKRFKPVCMFEGPRLTDSQGKAKVSFEMPNYVGSVRVMVIAAQGDSYASEDKTVAVKSDLIIQPTIPRALKPGDVFEVPVNVFATRDKIGAIDLSIETEGPLEVIGQAKYTHTFDEEDDQMFHFQVKVKSAIGQSKITLRGKGKGVSSSFEADVPVSPSAARVYAKEEKIIKPGETIAFKIPKVGIDGTNNARLNLSVFPNMDFLHRLDYLIRYPYGCIEQTTSSVFPQLALKSFFADDPDRQKEIDTNINAGIDRLRTFQLSNGGFSYWPGGDQASSWGSNYAAQFLVEARQQGYVVPDGMYDGVIRYLERETRSSNSNKKYLMTRVNRCLVLAMADKAPIQEMNLLKQNSYKDMNPTQKWQLVTAYKLAGAYDKVEDLIGMISMDVAEYNEFAHTYGSRYRDLGLILRCLVILDRKEDAALLAKKIAEVLSSRNWYSTQTVGQMLLGVANYFELAGVQVADDLILQGSVLLPNGTRQELTGVDQFNLYINEGYGEELKLTLGSEMEVSQMYASLSANGVPLTDQSTEENKNLSLKVDWYDEDGYEIDVAKVKQGETFYARYRVGNKSVVPLVEEVALVQLLPSGWEIENMRLSGEVYPEWMADWNVDREEYLDIRDDRIMWFFDIEQGQPLDFVVKINAITKGKYQLPGARCEAMYNNDFMATQAGLSVTVVDAE
ncbi:alpha-2-macroglobulin [Reichenbachiella sp. 5M10]|uniref:alpha-2-macroglobulin family protein n=1 Tax=Reichenbachiella sp. 5M10 TaxID=1889772 RepID=UPI00117B1D09|nr:MG2 domain-containing protein [Reichenbachiella sp. 5M10]